MTNDITREEYREEVQALAKGAINDSEEYDMEIAESVWQRVDGHQWIIYYGYNPQVLQLADSDPEEWKHLVEEDSSYRDVIQALAYKALEQDVWEEVNRHES